MPGRDKAGLDGAAWEKLPDTEIAIRTASATGADARSTYSQVTAPKTESKEEKDPSALLLLSDPPPGASKEEVIARIKMDSNSNEGKAVGGADEGKSEIEETSAADTFDLALIHVLSVLLSMQLDGRHSRVRNILRVNGIVTSVDLFNITQAELLRSEYEDDAGTIFRFDRSDRRKLRWVHPFRDYLIKNKPINIDLEDPCTWSPELYQEWRSAESVQSENSRIGTSVSTSKSGSIVSGLSSRASHARSRKKREPSGSVVSGSSIVSRSPSRASTARSIKKKRPSRKSP